jgi:dimethylhistidine N-methyltransferase
MLVAASRALLDDFPGLEVTAVAGEYADGLRLLAEERGRGPARLVAWLGSNVGNFDREGAAAFLRNVRAALAPADRLLVGVDLRKERRVLEAAYDDAQGVTARFNLNLLARINRELGGRFDLGAFRHRAVYLEGPGRIEMYLVSARRQRVHIEALARDFDFADGEAIHTEDSYKYSPDEIAALAAAAGFTIESAWTDAAARFSLVMLAPV